MIKSGLLSITFRKHSPREIIELAQTAQLDGIEWGGDIHVPPGQVDLARDIKDQTEQAGLEVASYGSYYKAGVHDNFEAVLESAVSLGAPVVRVWAGDRGTQIADDAWWEQVVRDTQHISALASREHIGIAFEYHANTLTDQISQAVRLLEAVNDPNVSCYWQPVTAMTVEENREALSQLKPWLSHLHVFHWNHQPFERRALEQGEANWEQYIQEVNGLQLPSQLKQRFAMLEFVRDDSPDQFLQDAIILKRFLAAQS